MSPVCRIFFVGLSFSLRSNDQSQEEKNATSSFAVVSVLLSASVERVGVSRMQDLFLMDDTIFNRPGVAGAVLQTPPSLTD